MPKFQITAPDGTAFEVTAPEGASEADVIAYAQQNFKKQAEPTPAPVDFSGNLQFGPFDTGIPLPPAANKRLAQLGSGLADWVLGAKQRIGLAKPSDATEKRSLDKQLNDDTLGKALNFGGKVLPAFAVPAAGVVGGVAGGALMGAMEPTAEGESALKNTLVSGALGGALPAAGAIYRGVMAPTAEKAALGRLAAQYDVPVGLADLSSNKLVKATRSVLNDTPFVGSISGAQDAAKKAAFGKAVGGTFGASSLDAAEVAAAKGRVMDTLNRIWGGNMLKPDAEFINDLGRIGQRAADLNPDQQAMVMRMVKSLAQKANNQGIPGNAANNWQSELRLVVDGEKGLAKDVLNDLRQSVLRAFNRGVAPEDAAALMLARRQYGNFKTIKPLLDKAEVGVAGRLPGEIAGILPGAVAQGGTQELKDLAKIGSHFVADRTMQTGGSPRSMLQNGILGSALTASGGLASLPMAGATAAGSAGLNFALGSPGLARRFLTEKQVRGLLSDPELTPAMLEAARKALFLSAAGAPLALSPAE